jgi:hypothetical protein
MAAYAPVWDTDAPMRSGCCACATAAGPIDSMMAISPTERTPLDLLACDNLQTEVTGITPH